MSAIPMHENSIFKISLYLYYTYVCTQFYNTRLLKLQCNENFLDVNYYIVLDLYEWTILLIIGTHRFLSVTLLSTIENHVLQRCIFLQFYIKLLVLAFFYTMAVPCSACVDVYLWCIYRFFRETWCLALYHDRFSDFRDEVRELLVTSPVSDSTI